MKGYSDEILIQRTLNGDMTAFGILVARYRKAVHALIYRKLGDFHEAQDVLQETFLRAHQKLPALRDRAKFAGWLYAIAINCSRMALRRRERQGAKVIPFDKLGSEQINQMSLANHIRDPENLLLQEAMDVLPTEARKVLELYYMEEMSCSDIGGIVGASANAVRDRLYRARKRLRKEMMIMTKKPDKSRFEWIGLEFCVAGSSDSTRLFHAVGNDPAENPLSFGDAKKVIDQFAKLTKVNPPVVKGVGFYPYYELTAHPDFLSFWELMNSLSDEVGKGPEEEEDPEAPVLSTNGYGIARAENYLEILQKLKNFGVKGMSLPLHGLEEHHDWFAHRKGAFQDVFLTAERAVAAGLEVYFNVWVDRISIPHLPEILGLIDKLRKKSQVSVTQFIAIPRYIVTGKDEVQFFESELRPRLSDLENLPPDIAPVEPPYDKYTEKSWIERIFADPTDPSLMTEGFDDVSDDSGCYILIIDRSLDIYREPYNFDWPPLRIGNLRTDGLSVILDKLEASQLPPVPDLVALAEKYGDRDSMLIHGRAFSVRSKWLDMYWQDNPQLLQIGNQ